MGTFPPIGVVTVLLIREIRGVRKMFDSILIFAV